MKKLIVAILLVTSFLFVFYCIKQVQNRLFNAITPTPQASAQGSKKYECLSYRETRLSEFFGNYIQVVVENSDGQILTDTSVTIGLKEPIDNDLFISEFTSDGKESILMPYLALEEYKLKCNHTYLSMLADKEYQWSCHKKRIINPNNTAYDPIYQGFFKSPPMTAGKERYLLILKADTKAKSEKLYLRFSLTKPLGSESRVAAHYLQNGELTNMQLKPGQESYSMRIPALNGELMLGGSERLISMFHINKVADANLGRIELKEKADALRYSVILEKDDRNQEFSFHSDETSLLPVSWMKVEQGVDTAEVWLRPGTYWVRRYYTGPVRHYAKSPFAKISVGEQRTIDFTPYNLKGSN